MSAAELSGGHLPAVSRDLVTAVERLRTERDLPRHIYIRPTKAALRRSAEGRDKDTKPVYIDLESYLFLKIFHRWLGKAGELEVTKCYPIPIIFFGRNPTAAALSSCARRSSRGRPAGNDEARRTKLETMTKTLPGWPGRTEMNRRSQSTKVE